MNSLTNYFIESGIALALFYSVYYLFLRNETYFKYNRFVLLGSFAVALLIPLLHFPATQVVANNLNTNILLGTITATPGANQPAVATGFNWQNLLLIIYLSGVFMLLLRIIVQVIQILKIKKQNHAYTYRQYHIVTVNGKYSPFSFFNTIFVPGKLQPLPAEVLEHEMVHAQQKHSLDVLVFELATAFLWFNPLVWLYRKAIGEVHEYLADAGALHHAANAANYQKLLIEQLIGCQLDISNNLNKSLTLKRLTMIKKVKSSKISMLKLFVILPAFLLAFGLLACDKDAEPATENEAVEEAQPAVEEKTTETEEITTTDPSEVLDIAENMPEFPGDETELRQFLAQNISYPDEAREQGISGKVYIKFAVMEDGHVDHVQVVRGVHELLDNEAIRVVKLLPDWKPGTTEGKNVAVWFTIPINFALQ